MKRKSIFIKALTVFAFNTLLLSGSVHAQLALAQRMDLGLGSDRKLFTGWLLKQGFHFDTESQATTRTMALGISTVSGSTHYGETYLNNPGNIRIRIFTDTVFTVQQIQTIISHPVTTELTGFIKSLVTLGYVASSTYYNKADQTMNTLMTKGSHLFTLIQPADKSFLLVKCSNRENGAEQ